MPAQEINNVFCTLDDLGPAIQAINENFTNIYNLIEGSSTLDTFKVMVNAADPTPDYLHAKLNDPSTYDSSLAGLVSAEALDDTTVRLFWRAQDIPGYAGDSTLRFLGTFEGAMAWTPANSSVDDHQVLVTVNDSTPSYLHTAFHLNATYVSNADILVGTATVGASSTNQTERLFVDVSAITNYNASGVFLLGLVDNVSQYIAAVDVFEDSFTVKCTASDTTDSFLHAAFTTAATRDSNADPIVAAQTASPGGNETETLFVDSSAITGWDAAKPQQYINDSGTVKFDSTFKVSATSGDTVPSALHDAIHDNGTFIALQDAIVKNETAGIAGTDQKERLFFDSSAITGWDTSKVQLLGHDMGTLQWDTLVNWLKKMTSYDANKNQSVGHDSGSDPTWQEDTSACP